MDRLFVSTPRGAGWSTVRRARLASGAWLLLLLGAPLREAHAQASTPPTAAAPPAPPGIEAPEVDPATAPRNRSYLQAAMTKLRPGAMLKAEVPWWTPPAELRGRLGKARDEAVQLHYSRIAELDYLADGAAREHDVRLSERIDQVRRREIQRFFRHMQALQVATATYWERRLP